MLDKDNSTPTRDESSSTLLVSIRDTVSRECQSFLGDELLALILTGSVARDEASLVSDASGLRFLSDAEFVVVVRSAAARALQPELSARIEVALSRLGLRIHVTLALVQPDYLRRLPPHIFTYELRACGQILAGDPEILSLIPGYAASELSREDAWRLLANRMTEFLESTGDIVSGSPTLQTEYRAIKLFLDMATSLLVFLGEYEPAYRARSMRLATLAARDPSLFPFPAMEFASLVAQCTAFKLSPEGLDLPDDLWRQAVAYARLLWTWELRRLTQSDGDDETLFRLHCRRLSASVTLRGWMYAVRAEGWLRGWRHWPHWLGLFTRGTPRYCVYRAAHLLFSHLPAESTPSRDISRSLEQALPVSHVPPGEASWKDLAGDIVWNYRRFVVETRA